MKDIAKQILLTDKTKVSLFPDQLELNNELYGIGLSDATLELIHDRVVKYISKRDLLTDFVHIVHELEDPETKTKCYVALYSKGQNKWYAPIYFLGGSYFPKEIKVGQYFLSPSHDKWNQKVDSIYKQFIFDYEPDPLEAKTCKFLVDRRVTKQFHFTDKYTFQKAVREDPDILKAMLTGSSRGKYNYFDINTVKAIYSYYEQEFDLDNMPKNVFGDDGIPGYTNKIIDVRQATPTDRLVLIARPIIHPSYYNAHSSSFDDNHDYELFIKIVGSKDPQYDYCDAGRIFLPKNYTRHAGQEDPFPGKAFFLDIFDEDFPDSDDHEPLEHYLKNRKDGALINPERLKQLLKKYEHIITLQNASREVSAKVKEKIEKKLETLVSAKSGTFVLNGVTYDKNKIVYEKNELSFDKVDPADVLRSALRRYRAEIIDFDLILDYFVGQILVKNGKKVGRKASGKIGSLDVQIEYKGKTGTRTYVNNHRVNNGEVIDVLKRALCYDEEVQYDTYLTQVSRCSLNIYNYLVQGLRLRINDEFLLTQLEITLPLERVKNRTILKLGTKNFPISDINKFLRLEKERSMQKLLQKLTKGDIIKDITVKDIFYIIEQGMEFHDTMIKREKDMRERMEKMFDIKEHTVQFTDGSQRSGYLVPGVYKNYFVSCEDAQAYTYPDGNRICMITKNDTSTSSDNLTVRIFERVMVLKNDARVADRVATLAAFKNIESNQDDKEKPGPESIARVETDGTGK